MHAVLGHAGPHSLARSDCSHAVDRSSEVGDLVPASPGALETVSTIAEEEPTPGRLVGTINEEEKKKAAATPRMAPRLTAAELDKPVTISLVETPTFWLLDIGATSGSPLPRFWAEG